MKQVENDELVKILKRRAYFLRKFFKSLGVDITLLGDSNSPLMVTSDNIALSCYLHNFELIFKDCPRNGKELFRIKLKHSLKQEEYKEPFDKWFNEASHRKVFLFKSGDFYFSKSVHFLDTDYPLYTKSKRLAYFVFSMEKAIEIKKKIGLFDKNVKITI